MRLTSRLAHFQEANILTTGYRSVVDAHRGVHEIFLKRDGFVILSFEFLYQNGVDASQFEVVQDLQQEFTKFYI